MDYLVKDHPSFKIVFSETFPFHVNKPLPRTTPPLPAFTMLNIFSITALNLKQNHIEASDIEI